MPRTKGLPQVEAQATCGRRGTPGGRMLMRMRMQARPAMGGPPGAGDQTGRVLAPLVGVRPVAPIAAK
jgi:hypothetical protein